MTPGLCRSGDRRPPARRIVSLLPSATEIVCVIGLGEQLVGVTHECDFPAAVRRLPKVTRTLIPTDAASREIDRLVSAQRGSGRALYELDLPALTRARPDLIITQSLCDVCAVEDEQVVAASRQLPGPPEVVHLEPVSLEEVLDSIRQVGQAAGVLERAERVVIELTGRVAAVSGRSARVAHRPRVALLEWLDPPFSCGHWNPQLVSLAGGVEVLGQPGQRSRRLTWQEVADAGPEVVVIACCGLPVERALEDVERLADVREWAELPAVREGRVYVTDGASYFSRPGPRLVDSLEILAHALHPQVHPLPPGVPDPLPVATARPQ